MVTSKKNCFLRRRISFLVHVPFRMRHIVGIVSRCGIWCFPYSIWVSKMGNQCFIVRRNIFVDWFKDSIVRHDVVSVSILHLFADVLPYLDGDGSPNKIMPNAGSSRLSKTMLSVRKWI